MVSKILEAASNSTSFSTFQRYISLLPPQPGMGPLDWERALAELFHLKAILIEDEKLKLGEKPNIEWLSDGLRQGDPEAWKILDFIDPSGNIEKKFNNDHLLEIGESGEQAVMRYLDTELPVTLRHRLKRVSLFDDTLGYDIESPTLDGKQTRHFEVKTSTRETSHYFQFYLSRNEARVAMSDASWCLVAVKSVAGVEHILGHFAFSAFEGWLPINHHDNSNWESVKVDIPRHLISPGLPI